MNQMPVRVAQVMGKMDRGGVEAVVMNYYALWIANESHSIFLGRNKLFPQRAE
jgi:hypothetical protein